MAQIDFHRHSAAAVLALAAACGSAKATPGDRLAPSEGKTIAQRIVACRTVSLEEMSALTGESYSIIEPDDDPTQPSSKCQYTSPTDPAGTTLDIDWITPGEYSSEAEHLAMRQALLGGERLGGSLAKGIVPGEAMKAMPSGAVDSVGDEATVNMGQLAARKGDVRMTVIISPSDMMAFVTDPKVSRAILEKEKAVLRTVISRLP